MRTKYFYDGSYHSISSLERLSGISRTTLTDRLKSGWSVKMAVTTPAKTRVNDLPPAMYKEGPINVRFTQPILEVFPWMQPTLGKIYKAEPHCPGNTYQKAKLYYVITLDNNKPLIVYPGEFEWLGKAEPDAA
jgi:hypothetical protein